MDNYFDKLHSQYLEPEESKSYGLDWKGHEIYEGDECWDVDGEYVKVEDAEAFLNSIYVKRTAGE